jgi:hypothetical protein
MLGVSLTLFMLFPFFLGGTNSSWNQFPFTPHYLEALSHRKAPNPTQVARGKVFERLAQIYQEDGGTVIAQSRDLVPNATREKGLSIKGYIIEELVVDPPLYVEATNGYLSTQKLCLAEVKIASTFDRLWRITVLGSGFSIDYPVGGNHEPSPVSIWMDDTFLGYAWRNDPFDLRSGPTLLIHDSTPLKEGAVIGIGQTHAFDIAWTLTPTPMTPTVFSQPIHFLKSPES